MTLTRRLINNDPEYWGIMYGDVRVGTIGKRSGVLQHVDQWQWHSGFYPGCGPGEIENGTGATYDEARERFTAAWERLAPRKTEADFQEWRDFRDWTAWKYAMHDGGCQLPTQTTNGRSKCFCGAEIGIDDTLDHVLAAHRPVKYEAA
jgi:hypothetical protein